MTIETERLILRPWSEEDAESLYGYAKDERVGPQAGWAPHTSVENSLEIIRKVLSKPDTYAVVPKSAGHAAGSISIMRKGDCGAPAEEDEAEIGYWIGVPFWGQGLIPEAVRALLHRCFEELGLNAVWCGYYEGNEKSKRVMEKCGFRYHHSQENMKCAIEGLIRTEHFTRITKEEWKKNRQEEKSMNKEKIKVIAFDLDGTLTQHRTKLGEENRAVLTALSKKYKLLMAGAGKCQRIFDQMDHFPIDILGNYGLQYAEYQEDGTIRLVKDNVLPCDRESVDKRVTLLREKYGFTEFKGENVEFHPSGCVTIPLLGTKADIADKLAFDPDRKKRRAIYAEVKELFSDYIVFVGGSSSFDMTPAPYNKAYALSEYCREHGIAHDEVVYVGDDYGEGGNDESVYQSDFNFIKIDDYRTLPELMKPLL